MVSAEQAKLAEVQYFVVYIKRVSESEYAFKLHKKVVPIRMQTGFQPDKWLGALCGSKLIIEFSDPTKFDDSVGRLIKELRSQTGSGKEF
jgi:hypothetical protein